MLFCAQPWSALGSKRQKESKKPAVFCFGRLCFCCRYLYYFSIWRPATEPRHHPHDTSPLSLFPAPPSTTTERATSPQLRTRPLIRAHRRRTATLTTTAITSTTTLPHSQPPVGYGANKDRPRASHCCQTVPRYLVRRRRQSCWKLPLCPLKERHLQPPVALPTCPPVDSRVARTSLIGRLHCLCRCCNRYENGRRSINEVFVPSNKHHTSRFDCNSQLGAINARPLLLESMTLP